MTDVTQVLELLDAGHPEASEQLLLLVYDELRRLAAQRMSAEPADHTLQATALVHEAYLRLVDGQNVRWNSRGHFFGAAAEAMRRILIERARRKESLKGGGSFERHDLWVLAGPESASPADLLDLDAALTELELADPQKAQLVKLRFFAGLSLDETADALGISVATAKRYWSYARAWLYGRLSRQ